MEKNLVVQASALIEAHYKQTYTIQELRTVLWMISEIHKEDYFKHQKYEHKTIEISVKKYAEIMGINVDNVYRDAKKIADELGSKRFTIRTNDGWINFGWISSMEYKHTEGIIKILISPDLLPYIIDLKQYTSFKLENILSLGSSHAIKLYQLLVQYKSIGERTASLDDLRSMLGITKTKSYLEYKNFKKRILDISKREINEHTDLNISYVKIKKGRKVESIKFKITQKQRLEINPDKERSTVATMPNCNSDQIRLSTIVLEDAKKIIHKACSGYDIYDLERQFQDYAIKKGNIKNSESAFIGFVKKKVIKRP